MRTAINRGVVLKILETEISVLGISYSDIKFIVLEALAAIALPVAADMLGYTLGTFFYLFVAVLMLSSIIILRRMSKSKYKNYAISVLQFRLWQPKLIRPVKSE